MSELELGTLLPPQKWLEFLEKESEDFDRILGKEVFSREDPIYISAQKKRYAATVREHAERFGSQPCVLLRAPGRLNAFLEYLDMCAGDHMSTTLDGDIPLCFTPRGDDLVILHNTNPIFPERTFRISEEEEIFKSTPWGKGASEGLEDTWDHRTRVYPHYGHPKGDHANYVIGVYLRFAWERPGSRFKGGNFTFGPSTIPLRAGTSSSSAVVVLAGLACLYANSDFLPRLTRSALARLLGEAEWYVGTHGGANDHATILCNPPGGILYNRHSQKELVSTPLPFLRGLRIVVANSLWEANKALGANYVFNLRKGWMDLGNDLMVMMLELLRKEKRREPAWVVRTIKENFPWDTDANSDLLDGLNWEEIARRYNLFGSLDSSILGIPQESIEQLINLLPEEIDPDKAGRVLGKSLLELERDYTLPNEIDRVWRPRKAARFFNRENLIGRRIEALLLEAEEAINSGVDPESEEYDAWRRELGQLIEKVQETIRDDFMVSNDQLELLLSIAREGPGYVGGKLTGAGSGGCVCIFVREKQAEDMCKYLDEKYYRVPSNFDAYRKALAGIEDEAVRGEMELNLEKALSDPASQRRIVSFSRGAAALPLP